MPAMNRKDLSQFPHKRRELVAAGALCVLALLAAVNLWRLQQQIAAGSWGIDFLWRSISLLSNRENPYEIYLNEIHSGTSNPGTPNYPVSGLISMLPLAFLAEAQARWVWLFVNLGVAGGMLWLLQATHKLPRWAYAFATLAFLASSPLRIALLNSQTSLYVLFLFLLAMRVSARYPWLAGLLLTVSLMKYSVTLPLAMWFGLSRERFRTIPWAVGWQCMLILIGSFWMKCGFMDALLGPLRLTAAGGVAMGHVATDLFSISHHAGIRSLTLPGVLALACLLLFYVLLLSRDRPSASIGHGSGAHSQEAADNTATIGFLAVLSCLLFFHLPYDHVLLLFTLWWGLGCATGKAEKPRLGWAVVIMVMMLWLPNEIWIQISRRSSVLTALGNAWWRLGFSELVRFLALLGLLVVAVPGVAAVPSLRKIKTALGRQRIC